MSVLSSAAASAGPPTGPMFLVGLLAVGLFALGLGHYRGWNKAGLLRTPFDSLHFMPAWFGGAGMLTVLAAFSLSLSAVLALLLFAAAAVLWVVTMIALFWLPDRLLPAWYLSWRSRGRPGLEVANRFDRRASRGRAPRGDHHEREGTRWR